VIDGSELHCVPRGSLDSGRHHMLFGPSPPQRDLMELGTGRQPKCLNRLGGAVRDTISGLSATSKDRRKNQQRKKASPREGGRPRNPREFPRRHFRSAAVAQGPDVRGYGPYLLIGDR
jgi:hypothetical protein